MKYYTGDVIFTRNKGIFARGIRLFTKSQINHVGIIYEVAQDGYKVAEATNDGFTINFYHNNYIESSCEVRRYFDEISKEYRDELRSYILKSINIPYDWMAIKRIALNIITLGIYKGKKETERLWICSEAVARIYYDVFKVKLVRKTFDKITPEDLRRAFKLIIKSLP